MIKHYDAAVIGGGLLGCFAARNLRKWNISTVLLEASEDVCTGISKANTAVVYAGYDNKPGTLKADMTVRANQQFDRLCQDLGVSFSRCGSLMVSYDPQSDQDLIEKYKQGQQNKVAGLQLISAKQAYEIEPLLAPGITSALYAPTTGTVSPWHLCIAAYENAVDNGADVLLSTEVQNITKTKSGYTLETNQGTIHCQAVINCAGLSADKVQELCFEPNIRIFPDGADYLIMDKAIAGPKHIIFQQTQEKGITIVPTVEGNLLAGATSRPLTKELWGTSLEGITFLKETLSQILPSIDSSKVIRSFASVRPHPYEVTLQDGEYIANDHNIGNFIIDHPDIGFYSMIGIKTPGLTCADELGKYVAEQAAALLNASKNEAFHPKRKITTHKDNEIICLCEKITKAEIIDAIRRGAATIDGIKRRAGTGMGRCQGSRCSYKIEQILKEYQSGTL